MKTIAEINGLLHGFEGKFGYSIGAAQQGSEAWFISKLGVLSASEASCIVAKVDSATRDTYMCKLIAQICTGYHHDFGGKALDWGREHEDAMLAYYEFQTGLKLTKVPFIFKDDSYREGCSPDALVTDKKGCEIKCPFDSANYVKFLLDGSAKPEWRWQNQFTMRVTGAEQWDFGFFDPRMKKSPMKIMTIDRDEKMQKTLEDAVPQFISDMDAALKTIGIEFGEQWTRLKSAP
jgi:hypothetical protein